MRPLDRRVLQLEVSLALNLERLLASQLELLWVDWFRLERAWKAPRLRGDSSFCGGIRCALQRSDWFGETLPSHASYCTCIIVRT